MSKAPVSHNFQPAFGMRELRGEGIISLFHNSVIPIVFLSALTLVSCSSLRFAQGVPESPADWPMFGRSASHTSAVDLSSVRLQKIWETNVGAGFGDYSPIVEHGTVFVGTLNGGVASINIRNGKKIGSKIFGAAIFSPPIIYGNLMVVASSQAKYNLFGYDLESGKIVWNRRISDVESAPTYFDSSVYVATVGGDVYRIDPASGREVFHKHFDAAFRTSPALCDSICVVGCDDGYIYGLSPLDGDLIWKHNAGSPVWCSASVGDSLIFVGSNAGKLLVLTKMGKLSYELPKPSSGRDKVFNVLRYNGGDKILSMPIADKERVYFGCNDGNFYAVNKSNGSIAWVVRTGGPIIASPVQTRNQVIFGSFDENLYVVNKSDGKVEQKIDLKGRVRTSVAVYKGYLVVCVENERVVGFKIE